MIRLAVRCRPEQAEAVLARLTDLTPAGVEEVTGPGFVEWVIYGAEGQLPGPGQVEAAAGEGLIEVNSAVIADDWADRWKDFHRPVVVGDPAVGGRLRIRPPWVEGDGSMPEVVIDPGQAFGTGAHPTTRLCIEALLAEAARNPQPAGLTDLGSGSGVLSIAAARLGWNPVEAFDNEPAAVKATGENATVNGVTLTAGLLDLREGLPDLQPVTVANLTGPVLEVVAAGLDRDHLPGLLICSGLLVGEADHLAGVFGRLGLRELERRQEDDWASLVLTSGGN